MLAIGLGAAVAASPAGEVADGFTGDLLLALRHVAAPGLEPQPTGRVVVVAIDEATYEVAPFRDLPLALWAPFQAQVLEALLTGGASVIGYDVVFATSAEAAVRGYDRSFRLALRRGAEQGRVVVGQFLGGPGMTPHASYTITVGGPGNLRALDIVPDQDGVVRRIPLEFEVPPDATLSFARELAARAGGPATQLDRRPLRLNLGALRTTVPSYSFADIKACAERDPGLSFADRFSGKIVLIGVDLAVEDRHRTPQRFMPTRDQQRQPACDGVAAAQELPVAAGTTAGVFLHAAAVDQLLSGDYLREIGRLSTALLLVLAAFAGGLPPIAFNAGAHARLPVTVILPLTVTVSTAALAYGMMLPTGASVLAMLTAFAIAFLHRAGLIDRDRWRLRRTLGLYLPGPELRRLQASGQVPELGGETRVITIMFVDVANFSRISENARPQQTLVRLNDHFERLHAIVERHGGIIDRYVGDAVVALFGAPVPHEDHATRAVRAALEISAPIATKTEADPPGGDPDEGEGGAFKVRIGITTGEVLVGHIGSRRRFNYGALGDPVNLASRIEGLNKLYGSTVLLSRATVEAAHELAFRDVDRVRVVGREQPVDLFVPLPLPLDETGRAREEAFAAAVRLYRARAFAAAAAALQGPAAKDPVARCLLERCRRFLHEPPPAAWDGVWVAETK